MQGLRKAQWRKAGKKILESLDLNFTFGFDGSFGCVVERDEGLGKGEGVNPEETIE